MVGFIVINSLIFLMCLIHIISPSYARAQRIYISCIGFLILILTSITFSKVIFENIFNENQLYICLIPIFPVFIPIIGISFLYNQINKKKKELNINENVIIQEGTNYNRLIMGIYTIQLFIYCIVYLLGILKFHKLINYTVVMIFSSVLFGFLIPITWYIYKYNSTMFKKITDDAINEATANAND